MFWEVLVACIYIYIVILGNWPYVAQFPSICSYFQYFFLSIIYIGKKKGKTLKSLQDMEDSKISFLSFLIY